jgi:antitoxin (DNA-binding transcriptional repressor) of toxin-antitoxin stability system
MSSSAGKKCQKVLTPPRSVLFLISAPSTPPEARDEVIERAEAGEQVTVAEAKTAIAKRKPEPKPKSKSGYDINPAAEALFANQDQIHAFAGAMNTKAARKFITFEQQVDLAKQLIEGNIRALAYQPWVTQWLRQAGKAQSEIDDEERDDLYKQIPDYEIRDEVADAKSAAHAFVASLLKLEELWKKFPANLFFGDIGRTLDSVIGMIRQYRRTAGEKSADELERKLARLQELENKTRTQEFTIEGLRSEVEELREKLAATGTGGDMSVGEFQTTIKKWEETVETQKNIIRDRDNEIANLRAQAASREGAR